MLDDLINSVPPDLIHLILVIIFSLLIGLEQRRHHLSDPFESLFGTDRTFTLIGLLGFILYVIDREGMIAFLAGGGILAILLAVYYFQKMKTHSAFGITSIVTALITYSLAPIICTQPAWMALSVVVSILIITEAKTSLFEFSKKFDRGEFTTLAKFLVLIGVVLPLLPHSPVSPELNISPYNIWLAVVVISSISYVSYLIRKFIFPKSGIILSGILGGLYSSTATTMILAKKSRQLPDDKNIVPAIFLSIMMMYLRIFILALFFNKIIAFQLLPYLAGFVVLTFLIAIVAFRIKQKNGTNAKDVEVEFKSNPLEFKTSLLFAVLFVFFSLLTNMVLKNFGDEGLNMLSVVVGVTDIDPFILNLFQGKMAVAQSTIVLAVLNDMVSNNVLKMIYVLSMGDKAIRKSLILGFSILILTGILISILVFVNIS